MRFRCSTARATITVKPGDFTVEGGLRKPVRAMRIEFVNHFWDSEAAQRTYGWTDEERRMVEKTLTGHPDYCPINARLGYPRFYPAEDEQLIRRESEVITAVPRDPVKLRCVFSFVGDGGDSDLCPEDAVEGEDFCQKHLDMVKLASEGVTT